MFSSNEEPFREILAGARLLTVGDVADRLGVSSATVHRLAGAGTLPRIHVGRVTRFRSEDLEAFIATATEGCQR